MSTVKKLLLTDGSVDTKTKIGFGAYLFINLNENNTSNPAELIRTKEFRDTSSTRLELTTLLWALAEVSTLPGELIVYTDSQNIISLPGRRIKLEERKYLSSKGKPLTNHELYREFFILKDRMNFELLKVKGHKKSSERNKIEELFSIVDKASRKAMKDSKSF